MSTMSAIFGRFAIVLIFLGLFSTVATSKHHGQNAGTVQTAALADKVWSVSRTPLIPPRLPQ